MSIRKTFSLHVSLVLLLLLPGAALAGLSQQQVERLQLDLWRVRAEYHMSSVMDGNEQYRQELSRALDQARETFNEVSSAVESEAARSLVNELREDWQAVEGIGERALAAERGQVDHYDRQDLNHYIKDMALRLEEFGGGASGEYDALWAMAAYMQRMTSEYLALAANPAGGMGTGTDAGRIDFHDTVPTFDGMLEQARQDYGGDGAAQRALDDIGARWGFIRESLINFHEDAVPFLVHRYNREIVDSVAEIAG